MALQVIDELGAQLHAPMVAADRDSHGLALRKKSSKLFILLGAGRGFQDTLSRGMVRGSHGEPWTCDRIPTSEGGLLDPPLDPPCTSVVQASRLPEAPHDIGGRRDACATTCPLPG